MAIDSFTKLVSEIQAYSENDDLDSTRAKEFIALFEARADMELRTREMLTIGTATALPLSGEIPLPAGFNEQAQLSLVNGDWSSELDYVPLHVSRNLVAAQNTDPPVFYTVEDDNLRVIPAPDQSTYQYTLDYYGHLTPKLSDSQASNWLLAKAPQIYLWGSLYESACFFEDDDAQAKYDARYEKAKNSLHAVDRRARYKPRSRTRAYATSHYEGRRGTRGR